MHRYLITSPTFNGQVECLYSQHGELLQLQFPAGMPPDLIMNIKSRIPAHSNLLAAKFEGTSATIVQAEIEVTFEMFWHDYPNKRNRHLAEPVYNKLPKTDQVLAYVALKEYRKYCDRERSWYKAKIADTWLKKKEYLNDWQKL